MGRLTDTDTLKLMNLPFVDSIMTWDQQELECWLPKGHDQDPTSAHVQFLVGQYDGPHQVWWWASWLGHPEHRDNAMMFAGPACQEDGCVLPHGHTDAGDERHIFV